MPHTEKHQKLMARGGESRDVVDSDGAHHIRVGRSFAATTLGRIRANILTYTQHGAEISQLRVNARALGSFALGSAFWGAVSGLAGLAAALSLAAVSVEVGYRIRAGKSEEFMHAVSQLRASPRRDGATTFWRVYRDLGDPCRYVERFIVASWADYPHQRSRATLADQELEARVREFLRDGEAVTMQHYIAER